MRDLFPNAWHVARREYVTRVRSRTFLIVTAAIALVGLGLALAPLLVRLIEGDPRTEVGLVAEPETVDAAQLQTLLVANADGSGGEWRIVTVADAGAGREQVRAGELDGLLSVVRAENGDLAFEAYTDAGATDQRLLAVRTAAAQLTIADRLDRAGVDPAQAGEIFAPTSFEVDPVNPDVNPDPFASGNGVVAYVLVILTFMAIITYGTWVATSVAEEKSSRVMELLITAASPRQLLAGKVLGAGAAGLTQYVVVLAGILVGMLLQGVLAERLFGEGAGDLLERVNFGVLVPFSIFFVSGFLLYCILYAGFGSMASRQEDVNQVTMPMLLIGMGGYFASFIAMATPNLAWVKLLSLVPFFSPYLLTARYALTGDIAAWEWVVAGALMALFLAASLWLAARIYSAGVLLYGQRASLRSVWRAVRVNR